MRRKSSFTQADIARAIKAVMSAGLDVQSIEIGPDGTIVVVTTTDQSETQDPKANEWDTVLE